MSPEFGFEREVGYLAVENSVRVVSIETRRVIVEQRLSSSTGSGDALGLSLLAPLMEGGIVVTTLTRDAKIASHVASNKAGRIAIDLLGDMLLNFDHLPLVPPARGVWERDIRRAFMGTEFSRKDVGRRLVGLTTAVSCDTETPCLVYTVGATTSALHLVTKQSNVPPVLVRDPDRCGRIIVASAETLWPERIDGWDTFYSWDQPAPPGPGTVRARFTVRRMPRVK